MASAPTGGMASPDDENGNELQHEQQTEEDRRRHHMLQDGRAEDSVSADRELPSEPTRPDPSPVPARVKLDTLPSNWPDILAERLAKFSDDQRIEFDRQVYNRKGSNHTVSPTYLLELSALIAKQHGKPGYGRDLHEVNRDENMRAYYRNDEGFESGDELFAKTQKDRASSASGATPEPAQTPAPRPTEGPPQAAPSPRKEAPPIHHDAQRQPQRPAPRKAAPDRTGLVRKWLKRQLKQHTQVRDELNLPLSRAAQNEFERLALRQENERNALVAKHREEIKLLDWQRDGERGYVGGKWLARDLKGTPEAARCQQEADAALNSSFVAHDRRQALVANRVDRHGWDRAASSSTDAPSQKQGGPADRAAAESPSQAPKTTAAPPQTQDPNAYFENSSGTVLTQDRLRAMHDRYQQLREIGNIPSGMNEQNEYARLTAAQATVRKNVLADQHNTTQLLQVKHLAEQVATSSEWLGRDTNQPKYHLQARRASSLARLTEERHLAIDPRERAADDHGRADADEQTRRQNITLEASKGGRTLSAEERAILQASGKSITRDRGDKAGERSVGPKLDRGPGPGGKQNSRGGGGRGR